MTARHWVFTSYLESYPEHIPDSMHYLCYQQEVCPTTGRIHIQGYVQLRVPARLTGVKELLQDDACHVEKARGTPQECREYCSKADTAVAGTFQEFGTLQEAQGQRNDLLEAKTFIQSSTTFRDVLLSDAHVGPVARHLKWAKELFSVSRPMPDFVLPGLYSWQHDLLSDLAQDPDPRQIIWIYDTIGGTGKSTMARFLVSKHGAIILSGRKQDIHYAYNGQRIAIFDVARAASDYIPYEAIEDIKNGTFFCEKYESGMKVFPPPHVVVFANCPPAPQKFSPDRVDLRESDQSGVDSD